MQNKIEKSEKAKEKEREYIQKVCTHTLLHIPHEKESFRPLVGFHIRAQAYSIPMCVFFPFFFPHFLIKYLFTN